MSASALVVGEALIDEVVDGGVVSRHPGGSPANVALGLARLKVDTRLHTAIGDDSDGRLIHRHLIASGVALTAGSVTSSPTSQATATLAKGGSASYRFSLSWAPAHLDDLGSPTVIHTGSLGAFLSPGAEVTSDITRRGRRHGALITFDPNIRRAVMPKPDTTRALFETLVPAAHLTKLSDEDAAYLYPGLPPEDVLDRLLDTGVSVAAITRGGDGALFASGRERVVIPSINTRVTDTVGAGDSFMAALIWALAFDGNGWDEAPVSSDELTRIGVVASQAAAVTVSRRGADPPRLNELQVSRSTNRPPTSKVVFESEKST